MENKKPTHGYAATKEQLLKRLARAEGQIRGISRMVEEDRYCIDVLTQISAAQAALDRIALGLLSDHAHHCVLGKGSAPADPDERIEELMGAVGRLVSR
jgi:DNA-binding FrmR family transcriptional regulator